MIYVLCSDINQCLFLSHPAHKEETEQALPPQLVMPIMNITPQKPPHQQQTVCWYIAQGQRYFHNKQGPHDRASYRLSASLILITGAHLNAV